MKMRSSFAFMRHLDQWALGNGGVHEDRADRWLERCKKQGFDGIRVFGETNYWTGGDFYPTIKTVGPIWDWGALQNGHRPDRMTPHNDKIIRKLIEKLKKHDMICNYVVDATMKHSGINAGTIGHCIRQTANFMNALEKELGSVNLWIEGHNEWAAHNQAKLDIWELNQQALRFRREDQWPGSIITVSESVGANKFSYKVGGKYYDAVDIHPDRKGEWWKLPGNWGHLNGQGVPVYFSETIHYMSPEQWDYWVPKIPKWAGLSTKNWERLIEFMETSTGAGASFCVHDMTGQMTDPDAPISPLEEALRGKLLEARAHRPRRHRLLRHRHRNGRRCTRTRPRGSRRKRVSLLLLRLLLLRHRRRTKRRSSSCSRELRTWRRNWKPGSST
jgi:hypothetical protein